LQGTLVTASNTQPNLANIGNGLVIINGNVQANNANLGNLAEATFIQGTLTTNVQPNLQLIGNGVQVTIDGNLIPNSISNAFNLGSSANRWNDLYLAGETIYLGNSNITSNTTALILQGPEGAQLIVQGNSASTTLENGNSNIRINANGNITTSVAGNANIQVITGTGVNVAGTLNVTGNLTVVNANLGNLATANFVNVTNNLNVSGMITGDGGGIGNIQSVIIGNANVAGATGYYLTYTAGTGNNK
jgi:hypothetical protein